MTSRVHKIASLFALVLFAALAAYLFWRLALPRKDFYNELWAPAFLLTRGESPYRTAPLQTNLPAAWLPMVIGAFFPLGWLSEQAALTFWYLLNIVEVAALIYLIQDELKLHDAIALAAFAFFYPLTLNHFNLGQFSITAMLCWILALRAAESFKDFGPGGTWLPAFLVALALSKPHLGILSLLGFSQRAHARGGLRKVFLFWTRIGIACLALTLPLFIAYPNWIPDMLQAMRENPAWSYPSLFVVYHRFVPALKYPLWALTVLAALALNFQLWRKLPARQALYWSLALAPFVTHYVGSWDFVLLLPLFLSSYVRADWKRKIFLWLVYLAAWLLMARVQRMIPSHNHYFWWVPLWFVGAAALSQWSGCEAKN